VVEFNPDRTTTTNPFVRDDPAYMSFEQVQKGSEVLILAYLHWVYIAIGFPRKAHGGYLRISREGVNPMTPFAEQHPEAT
jgi:hypothetical protein